MEDPQIFQQLLHPQPPAGTLISRKKHYFYFILNLFIFSVGLLVRPLKNPALEMRNRPLALQLLPLQQQQQQHRQPRNFALL